MNQRDPQHDRAELAAERLDLVVDAVTERATAARFVLTGLMIVTAVLALALSAWWLVGTALLWGAATALEPFDLWFRDRVIAANIALHKQRAQERQSRVVIDVMRVRQRDQELMRHSPWGAAALLLATPYIGLLAAVGISKRRPRWHISGDIPETAIAAAPKEVQGAVTGQVWGGRR